MVKIELSPYNAATILSFLREYIVPGISKDDPQFKAIEDAVDSYESQLAMRMTSADWDDCNAENRVNQLIGKSPQS